MLWESQRDRGALCDTPVDTHMTGQNDRRSGAAVTRETDLSLNLQSQGISRLQVDPLNGVGSAFDASKVKQSIWVPEVGGLWMGFLCQTCSLAPLPYKRVKPQLGLLKLSVEFVTTAPAPNIPQITGTQVPQRGGVCSTERCLSLFFLTPRGGRLAHERGGCLQQLPWDLF